MRTRTLNSSLLVATALCGYVVLNPALAQALNCDDSIKTKFAPDAQTSVILVKAFKKGDKVMLSGSNPARSPTAANDVCLVKLMVGPGNPGPADAPSTSAGIGIEVWLPSPANWNQRVHAMGGGGWQGGTAGLPTDIASPYALAVAVNEGAVSSTTDTGHATNSGNTPGVAMSSGDFAMNPDGTINQVLWKDFAVRSMHEQAVKTKALATAYYGMAPKFSYWEGASTGGRQALNLAQNHPEDFDGIIGNLPALNWTRLLTGDLYAQVVFQRDLGGIRLTDAQQDLASNAAIHACDVVGGQHLGYIMDQAACRYDPTSDPEVLCGNDGGKNSTPDCLTKGQATALNKIWYGMTTDGSVPSPATDNGWNMELNSKQRWYGPARGTSLYNAFFTRMLGVDTGLTGASGFLLGSDQVALELQKRIRRPTRRCSRRASSTNC